MHRQAVALTIQGDRGIRLDDHNALGNYGRYRIAEHQRVGDRKPLWSAVLRYKWMTISILLLALAAGVASIVLTRPVYRAQAVVQIETDRAAVPPSAVEPRGGGPRGSDQQMGTLTDILTSRSMAQQAAAKLGLGEQPKVVANLHQGLAVDRSSDSRAITIGFESHDPQFATRAANAFAEAFVEEGLQRRLATLGRSRAMLEKMLVTTKAGLERSERQLVDYARAAKLLDVGNSAGQRQTITTASLVDLNGAYLQAQAARVQAQQRWQQAAATPVMNLPEVLGNPAIQNLTRQRAEFEANLQQELQRRQEEHPAVIQAKAQVAELNRQISTIAVGVRASIGNQYRVAAGQETALAGKVANLKAATFAEQGKTVRYDALKREADTNRNLYNSLQQRYQDVRIEATGTANPISMIDRAQVPAAPIRPIAALNMTLASLAGVGLALVAGFARNRTDRKVRGPADIEYGFDAPLLGVVPVLKKSRIQLVDQSRSPVAEAHHAICLALEPLTRTPEQKVLLLTSSFANEGKSTTTLKLAANLAAAGKNVLVIDGDMRKGSLHRMLELSNETGLANLLSQGASEGLAAAVQYSETYGFSVLTRGQSSANPAQLLAGSRFAGLLGEAVRCFDTVIIDGPPVLGLADAPRLSSMADATIFVIEANRTSRDDAEAALSRLKRSGAEQIGLVLTKYDCAKSPGSYDYAYRYDYGFSDPQFADAG